MLIFSKQNLAFLAVPKTGTTAFELAMRKRADIAMTRHRKHMPALRFRNHVAPFLRDTFQLAPEVMAVVRDPIEHTRSWYRYRSRASKDGTPKSTRGCSFDEFVLAMTSDDPPLFTKASSQHQFLTGGTGEVLVNHLFAHSMQSVFHDFITTRFGEEIVFNQRNVSPQLPAPLSPEVEEKLRKFRAPDFILYERVRDAAGHLQLES